MATVPKLTYEDLHHMLDYDPKTGTFTWREVVWDTAMARHNRKPGAIAGKINKRGYVRISICPYGVFYAHRLAWFYETGKWPPRCREIDHENRLPADNRYDNLRLATDGENRANSSRNRTKSESLPKGVFRTSVRKHAKTPPKKPYRAQIKINGRDKHLGHFYTVGEAEACFRAELTALYGEFGK